MNYGSWLSLVPPILVIIIASITRKINKGLIIGIITASLIANKGSLCSTATLIGERFKEHFQDIDTLYLYIFLFAVGSLIALLHYTGGAIAFAHVVTKKIRKKIDFPKPGDKKGEKERESKAVKPAKSRHFLSNKA